MMLTIIQKQNLRFTFYKYINLITSIFINILFILKASLSTIIFDFKQKFVIGLNPRQVSSEYYNQNKNCELVGNSKVRISIRESNSIFCKVSLLNF
jgi:hypothetical protein